MTGGSVASQLQYEHPPLPLGPVNYEQFQAWADGIRAEWVDGEIILMSPVTSEHQDVLGFLFRLVSAFVEARQLGRVFFMGFQMRLRARPSGREPDLLFVSNEHAERPRPTYLDGPADLVVEIVSPESVERDRVTKLAEYEAAGIPEYWLIDVLRREALFYRLGDDGRYHPGPIDADGFHRSTVLSVFRLRSSWLWQRPPPPLAAVAAETEA